MKHAKILTGIQGGAQQNSGFTGFFFAGSYNVANMVDNQRPGPIAGYRHGAGAANT